MRLLTELLLVERAQRAADDIPVVAKREIGGMSAAQIVNRGVADFAPHHDRAELHVVRRRAPVNRLNRHLVERAAGVPPIGRALLAERAEKQLLRNGRRKSRIRCMQHHDLVVVIRQNHQIAAVCLQRIVGGLLKSGRVPVGQVCKCRQQIRLATQCELMLVEHRQVGQNGGLGLGDDFLLQVLLRDVTHGQQCGAAQRRNDQHERKHKFRPQPKVGLPQWCERHRESERRVCFACPVVALDSPRKLYRSGTPPRMARPYL